MEIEGDYSEYYPHDDLQFESSDVPLDMPEMAGEMELDDEPARPPQIAPPLLNRADQLTSRDHLSIANYLLDPDNRARFFAGEFTIKQIINEVIASDPLLTGLNRKQIKTVVESLLLEGQGETSADPLKQAALARVADETEALRVAEELGFARPQLAQLTSSKLDKAEQILAKMLAQSRGGGDNETKLAQASAELQALIPFKTDVSRSELAGVLAMMRGVLAITRGLGPAVDYRRLLRVPNTTLDEMKRAARQLDFEFCFRVERPEDAAGFAPFETFESRLGWIGMNGPACFQALRTGLGQHEPLVLYGSSTRAALDGSFVFLVQAALGLHCQVVKDGDEDRLQVEGLPVLTNGAILTCFERCALRIRAWVGLR